ncbi:MAG: M48 family metallopeptidase [Candidatus Omnitrophota bacterium]
MDEGLKKAKSYSMLKYLIAISGIMLSVIYFITIQLSGFSSFIAASATAITGNVYLLVFIYFIVIGSLLQLISFPLDFLGSFRIEHKFGLSCQNFKSWLSDYLKKAAIGGLIYLILIMLIYYFLRISYLWWVYVAVIYFAFSVVLAKIFPIFIIPLFYKLTEISETTLKKRLILLADKAGVKILNVYKIGLGEKTKKANAAVCGLGSTKRILLSDTLLQAYTEDEIEAALGHELAHHKYHHFWKLTFFGLALTLLSFVIADALLQRALSAGDIMYMHDVSFFPVLALMFTLYGIATTPLLNYISRMYEKEADREAMHLIENPLALGSLMKKLTIQNMSDPQPGKVIKFFFYDHPPASERIKMCEGRKG